MSNFTPTVKCKSTGVETNPNKLKVQKVGSGETITITWTADGGTFPASGYFSWKPGYAGPAIPNRVSSTQLVLTYVVPANPVSWKYNVCLECNGTVQCEDPDIDNERPPGDEDDDTDQGGGANNNNQG